MGRVERIHLIATHCGPPVAVDSVAAETGSGLRGDRHHGDRGACDLTLIEAEALQQLAAESGLDLEGGASRRNLVTTGIDLGQLIGRCFRVVGAVCEGQKRCEPCEHLASLTDPVVLRGLVHTGLRATILESGTISVGDPVETLNQELAHRPEATSNAGQDHETAKLSRWRA